MNERKDLLNSAKNVGGRLVYIALIALAVVGVGFLILS